MDLQYLSCCGLGEIDGISFRASEKEKILELIINHGVGDLRSGLLFTGASRYPNRPPAYATRFKAYIEDNNLGEVLILPSFKNKNTQRFITTYLWVVNVKSLTAWWKQNRPEGDYYDD